MLSMKFYLSDSYTALEVVAACESTSDEGASESCWVWRVVSESDAEVELELSPPDEDVPKISD